MGDAVEYRVAGWTLQQFLKAAEYSRLIGELSSTDENIHVWFWTQNIEMLGQIAFAWSSRRMDQPLEVQIEICRG